MKAGQAPRAPSPTRSASAGGTESPSALRRRSSADRSNNEARSPTTYPSENQAGATAPVDIEALRDRIRQTSASALRMAKGLERPYNQPPRSCDPHRLLERVTEMSAAVTDYRTACDREKVPLVTWKPHEGIEEPLNRFLDAHKSISTVDYNPSILRPDERTKLEYGLAILTNAKVDIEVAKSEQFNAYFDDEMRFA